MNVPRKIIGGLILVLAVLVYLGLLSHPGAAPWTRVLLASIIAFVGTQVTLGKRLPGFRWRTRREIH